MQSYVLILQLYMEVKEKTDPKLLYHNDPPLNAKVFKFTFFICARMYPWNTDSPAQSLMQFYVLILPLQKEVNEKYTPLPGKIALVTCLCFSRTFAYYTKQVLIQINLALAALAMYAAGNLLGIFSHGVYSTAVISFKVLEPLLYWYATF